MTVILLLGGLSMGNNPIEFGSISNILNVVNSIVFIGLILIGVYAVLMNFRTVLLPQRIGRIRSFGRQLNLDGLNCDSGCIGISKFSDGKMSIPVQVELDDNSIITADVSPCCICIDRLMVGDLVGVTRVGNRIILQRASRIHKLICGKNDRNN
ncbi:MAG: hypothetical protein DRO94_00545 [Candidatus Altiarchaeales archaeon]|nr:MAG: hypothetical protein DRO95_03270 [Candidatus Altiarchaeales archaeon]RLI95405.1 MAG: hypothetical protein DRO94_00545 [Candidatus Altiarchaeales archaeon]